MAALAAQAGLGDEREDGVVNIKPAGVDGDGKKAETGGGEGEDEGNLWCVRPSGSRCRGAEGGIATGVGPMEKAHLSARDALSRWR